MEKIKFFDNIMLKNVLQPTVVHSLLSWFRKNQRQLPWRIERNVYAVWVSEVMLQQTQVKTVIPYFRRFMNKFPSVEKLAAAPEESVLKFWEGLGYYRRVRNLKKAAEKVVEEYNGIIPKKYAEFKKLPGVGDYIGAAVLSLSCDQPIAVVDGNVIRVLTRLIGIQIPGKNTALRRSLQNTLNEIIGDYHPGTFNEAFMELGALVCKPSNPDCAACPFKEKCYAARNDEIDKFPVKNSKKLIPLKKVVVGIIYNAQAKLYIQKRMNTDHLGGLWEFPGGKVEKNESLKQALLREILEETGFRVEIQKKLPVVQHAYTHFKVEIYPFICELKSSKSSLIQESKWINPQDFSKFPFPGANHKIFSEMNKSGYLKI